jgi:hypothetical protein
MRLAIVEVRDVLGLRGTINLLENPTLFYGRNLAGKTNIINLIRYCFVLGKAGKKYSEEKRLDKNELLLGGVSDGKATFYFEHGAKWYKLEYLFRRVSKSVTQKIALSKPSSPVVLGASPEDAVKHIEWEDIAQGSRELKDKFVELGIYSDVINLLISPSNVKNFTDAINNELVTIPDIIARQVSQVHNGAAKLVGNMEKLQSVLVQEKESYNAKFENLTKGFREQSSKAPEAITKTFVLGNAYPNLDKELKSVDRELSELPSQETQLELFKQRWATEFRDKFRKIADAKKVVKEREEVIKLRERETTLTVDLKSVEAWNATFKALPSKDNVHGLADFVVPAHDSDDFQNLLNPERIRKIFSLLEEAKSDLRISSEIAKRYGVVLSLSEVRSLASSYKKLSRAVKSPDEKPKGDESIICYSEDEKESAVFIPIDALLSNPNYLRGIRPTPSVYRTKNLSKKDLGKLSKEIETKVKDLEKCRDKLSLASSYLDEAKQLVPLLSNEVNHLDEERKQADRLTRERLSTWHTAATVLVETFKVKPQNTDLDTVEGIGKFIKWLDTILETIGSEFVREFKQAVKSAGIAVGADFNIEDVESLDELVSKQSKEMIERKQRLQKTKDWINVNVNEVKEVENQLLTMAYIEKVITTLDVILKQIQVHTNLEAMSEQMAQNIEENVRQCVEMILPEEMVKFRHVGGGKFLIEAQTGEPVTHPAGSHKAVISLGIMLTLSRLFDLPLILDEARDRFDYVTLRNTFQYVGMLCKDPKPPQICFVSYRTLDIEKDPETLKIVKNWNIYVIEKRGNLKTMTRASDIGAIP